MNYATTPIGTASPAPIPKAATAAQKRRAVPAVPLPPKGHCRSTFRPSAVRPAGAAAYGFLKTRFLPHFSGQPMVGSPLEKDSFYRCFELLCTHYEIEPIDTKELAYPYCREVALHEAHRLLRGRLPQSVQVSFEQENGEFVLNATETFNTQQTLFYIPLLPLHKMLQDRKCRKPARLLLCIFAYLYRVAQIPFYRDEDSYLYWNYNMLSQWITDDPEGWGEDFAIFNSQINTAVHIGETMLRRLYSKVHLERFGEWLSDFMPKDVFGKECHSLAGRFYNLWQDYPSATIYSHADADCLPDPESYDDTDCITMEKYISFVACTEGWLYNQLEQTINSEFGECNAMQEPVIRRCFNGQEQQNDSLDFECRLFPLINELCYLLNNYSHDT